MSRSMAAAGILLLLVLSLGSGLLDLSPAVRAVLQIVLVLVAVLIGSKVSRRQPP